MGLQSIFNCLRNTILLIAIISSVVDSTLRSCAKNGKAVPVIPSKVAGVWYEIARLPRSDVPACLKVIAPESDLNGNYTLQLEYISNVNHGWKPTNESLVFPWSEAKNGNFNLHYSNGVADMNVKFKYLGSMSGYAVVCGYTDLASGISIIRILSRSKLVNSTVKAKMELLANQFQISLSELTWVQQDGRCNGSGNLSIFSIGILFICFIFPMISKNILAS